jgi:hypothetical protein
MLDGNRDINPLSNFKRNTMEALQASFEDMRAGRVVPAEVQLAEMRRILAEKQGR